MCGIVGIVGDDHAVQVDPDAVRMMCAAIFHRGPDDEGIFAKGHVGLGMRRLSIIDVAGGQQPIRNEDGSIWVVFNGEIYNFPELREELESKGHVFYTRSDTEVIAHLYESYGSDCVLKLRGMFGFALYDLKLRKLLLARDRLGKKPLHYALHGGLLYFGSEIKSLIAVAPGLATLDNNAIAQFFYHGYVPDPWTVFGPVKKLPPGHILEFQNGSVRIHKYWDLPRFASIDLPEDECLARIEDTLADSVRMRLMSEVPLGALLSGGVDSSLVVAMMAKISGARAKTFSIGFSQADFNETGHARAVAEKFGTDHHELLVDADLWKTFELLTRIMDEPFADSSIIPTYHVSRIARQHVTVALSGDGGDELFAGYEGYLVHHRRRHLDLVPGWLGPAYHKLIYPLLPQKIRERKLSYNFPLNSRDRFVGARAMLPSHDRDLTVVSPEFLASVSTFEPPGTAMGRYYDEAPASDVVSRMQYTDVKSYLTADVLTKVDRMSMACSLEVRCPLLDHVFAELAATLPISMKIRNGSGKYLLKRLAQKLGVPSTALNRRKQGFALPLKHWMRFELRDQITSLLLEPRTLQRGYFRRAGIERMLDEHKRGDRDYSQELWQLLAFELWNRNFFEGRKANSSLAFAGARA